MEILFFSSTVKVSVCVCEREREREREIDSCGESNIRPDGERVRESKKERERKGE